MSTEVLDKHSAAKERAIRLKMCRDMTGLARDAFDKRYGIPRGTIQNWESARFGGLTPKGAEAITKAFHAEGIAVNSQWLLHGLGESPRFSERISIDNDKTQSIKNQQSNQDYNLITSELLFFRQHNSDPIDSVLSDNSMEPIFSAGDYVAGSRLYQDDIEKAVGQYCIVQTYHLGDLVRLLKTGSHPGVYHLIATNIHSDAKNIAHYDVDILSAAPVVWIRKVHKTYTG